MEDIDALHQRIVADVREWRENGYSSSDTLACPETREVFPGISQILKHQWEDESVGKYPRYLRSAQLQALETYWFLRLVKNTPKFMALYKDYYEGDDLLNSFGVDAKKYLEDPSGMRHSTAEQMIEKYAEDRTLKNNPFSDTFWESYDMEYPSYIFALTMGAGKTVLIGAIIATEFAMSMRYKEKITKIKFMQNALVMAPGNTIIDSLREISDIPYHKILPDEDIGFLGAKKIVYPSLKNKGIGMIANSLYNIVIVNTEKIIPRKNAKASFLSHGESQLEENHRLYDLKQLSGLGVFSDEAHHTYSNNTSEEKNLKRVRDMINRLHSNRRLICAVNTTGTPYQKTGLLKDVVFRYGLNEGIQDNVLKTFTFEEITEDAITNGKEKDYSNVVRTIIDNFFQSEKNKGYKDVKVSTGQKAKIAFYFNRQKDLDNVKISVENALVEMGIPSHCLLEYTQESERKDKRVKEDFSYLKNPLSEKRVILMIAKGREGWDCPSLFACALITPIRSGKKTSHNYVLQAATRCLRSVKGSKLPARLYLSEENLGVLNDELTKNFGEDNALSALSLVKKKNMITIEILKTNTPKLEIQTNIKGVRRKKRAVGSLKFCIPSQEEAPIPKVTQRTRDISYEQTSVNTKCFIREFSLERTAFDIALPLHLEVLEVLEALEKVYSKLIPEHHIPALRKQAENNLGECEEFETDTTRSMALVNKTDIRGNPLFREENGRLYHDVSASAIFISDGERQDSKDSSRIVKDKKSLSFHYHPYNLASKEEYETFKFVLEYLGVENNDIDGFYYTGGLTDKKKTDMWFEYRKAKDKSLHLYYPDFVLIKKNGQWLIIEVKSEHGEQHHDTDMKKQAVEEIVSLQPKGKLQYEIVPFAKEQTLKILRNKREIIEHWIKGEKNHEHP